MSWFNKKENNNNYPKGSEDLNCPKETEDLNCPKETEDSNCLKLTFDNPGLPESELKQIGYSCFKLGMQTIIIYGFQRLHDCYKAFSEAVPAILQSQFVADNGVVFYDYDGKTESALMGFESDEGSIIAYFCYRGYGSPYIEKYILSNIATIRPPWEYALYENGSFMHNGGVEAPENIKRIFRQSTAFPIWYMEKSDTNESDPKDSDSEYSCSKIPDSLCQVLQSIGGNMTQENVVCYFVIPISEERKQTVYLTYHTNNGGIYCELSSAFAACQNDDFPESLLTYDFTKDNYSLTILGDLMYLLDSGPEYSDIPSKEEIASRAVNLAFYADNVESKIIKEDVY